MKTRMQKTLADKPKNNEFDIPEYVIGKTRKKKKKEGKIPKGLKVFLAIFTVLCAFIYITPLFFLPSSDALLPSATVSCDDSMLQAAIAYRSNNPDVDFDGDGLTNEQELTNETNVYGIDNDGDYVTDYAELYLTKTNPRFADDAIVQYIRSLGGEANEPFKVHNVIMWADDYSSKAVGSVVPLRDGYKFSNFDGWVQFPEGKFAYQVVNGYQKALKENTNGQFYVSSAKTDVVVRVYDKPLETQVQLSLFGNDIYFADSAFGTALSTVLPSYGTFPITCQKVATADIDGTNNETATVNQIVIVDGNTLQELSDERFGRNQNSLEDLSFVFSEIDNEKNVIVSLFSPMAGEAFVEVYGYTNKDNLLIADPLTGKGLGYININVCSSKLLDSSETIQQYEWFEFNACGFNSANKHRISFPLSVNAA